MSFIKTIKKGVSKSFQPARWVGLEHIKANGKICADLVTDLVSSEKHKEFYQREKQKALLLKEQMTSRELSSRMKLALILVFFYLLGGLGLLGYAYYLGAIKSFYLPAVMSMIVALLVFTYSLRELMVYGQIRAKRSRITLKELIRYLVKGFPT